MRNVVRVSSLALTLSSALLVAGVNSALAASEADFKAAYAAAEAANKEAASLRDQWTTTAAALRVRKRPPTRATSTRRPRPAKEAEALAKASIYQARAKKTPGRRSKSTDLHFPLSAEDPFSCSAMDCFAAMRNRRGDTRMTIRRREFLTLAGTAALSPALPRFARAADNAGVYDLPRFGNARILHMTDTHAQL